MSLTESKKRGTTEILLKQSAFALSGEDKTKLFNQALREELVFHFNHNELYRRFCERHHFNPANFEGDLEQIPPVSVQVFKALGSSMMSIDQDTIKVTLESSATSGIPSTVLIDQITARRQTRAMTKVMVDFIGGQRVPFLILDVDPLTATPQAMGARGAAVRAYLNFASEATYVMRAEGDNLVFDEHKLLNFLERQDPDQPVVIFGFTYVLFNSLIRTSRSLPNATLPVGSKVIHIGGWKKLESEKISREEFNNAAAEVFGLSPDDIIDIYGFTEQMGLNYPDCTAGWKHVPSYSEVIVRDIATGMVSQRGEQGALEFISPVPHSYPGNAVITDDIGIIDASDEPCVCGRFGTRFKVLGRAERAEARGCGDIMSAKIGSPLQDLKVGGNSTGLEVLFHASKLDKGLDDAESLQCIIRDVCKHQEWLSRQPTEAIIGLINKASEVWQDPQFELSEFRERGLSFLVDWCRSANLRQLADFSLHGRRSYLDGFSVLPNSLLRQMRAVPKGLAVHWLSGNVPVLGMLTLVQAMVSKNANLLKASSSYSHAVPALLSAFEGLEYTTPGGYCISGDELLRTVSIICYGHGDEDLADMISEVADVRLAWGSAEAVQHVIGLRKKWSAEDIIFGPKLSFMVISKEAITSDRLIRKVLRRAATDCSVFDQTACASPHTIFVERGGHITPREFANGLAKEMEKALSRIPTNAVEDATFNAVRTIRSVYQFIGDIWSSENGDWTVLYDEEKGLANPTYSRVITVRPVESIHDAVRFASSDIQTIGLAAKGKKRLDFAEAVVARGVERCPDVGLMTNFEMPWDGVVVMDRMIRWATLGGPV